jgi:hypothetical protein
METNPEFNKYMDSYYDFKGLWDSPSRCGLKKVDRSDGLSLVIVTEIYRQNPGTAVTECVDSIATQLLNEMKITPEKLIFIEHTPDLRSRLTFYGETFDLVSFSWDGCRFTKPEWKRLGREEVDALMEG